VDWCTIVVSALIGFALGIGASMVAEMMLQPYYEKLREPDVTPSIFMTIGAEDEEMWITGRIQNKPITDWFKKRMVRHRNDINRLTISISIEREEFIDNGRKLLTPMIWDNGVRKIWCTDSPDMQHDSMSLPSSFRLFAETNIMYGLNVKVKAYEQDGVNMIDLPDGEYHLTMQVCADGRVIDAKQDFSVTSTHTLFVKFKGKISQTDRPPFRGI
jgi:hypothetical protein